MKSLRGISFEFLFAISPRYCLNSVLLNCAFTASITLSAVNLSKELFSAGLIVLLQPDYARGLPPWMQRFSIISNIYTHNNTALKFSQPYKIIIIQYILIFSYQKQVWFLQEYLLLSYLLLDSQLTP